MIPVNLSIHKFLESIEWSNFAIFFTVSEHLDLNESKQKSRPS